MTQGSELHLFGTVGASWWDEEYFTAASVREALAALSGPITVRINSGGGIATEGQAIYTLLTDYPDRVDVVIDGMAASAASLIAMAGDSITMRAGSLLLIHDPAQGFTEGRGTEADHLHAARQLGIVANAYAKIYADRASMSVEEARAIMRADTLFDGQMAVDMGFATSTDETPAAMAAKFDYRIYATAPAALRSESERLGSARSKVAVMAMIAGLPRPKMESEGMTKTVTTVAAEDSAVIPETAADTGLETSITDPASEVVAATEDQAHDEIIARAEQPGADANMRAIAALASIAPEMNAQQLAAHITANTPVTVVLDSILNSRKEKTAMTTIPAAQAATVVADARDKFKMGAQLALMAKLGMEGGERNEFTSLTLSEMAAHSLALAGDTDRIPSRLQMIGRALTMSGSHSTSDFANVLSNVASKSALKGWQEAEETYQIWTVAGVLSDFKPSKRVDTGLFGSLPQKIEGADYAYGTVGDRGETITLATYGKIFKITREAILNDDLSILGRVPEKMGRAARTTIGNLVYAILTSNPTMADGTALFHADHANLAGSGSALSVTSLSVARAAMRTQREAAGGAALNITPRYLIVPAAQEMAASQLMASQFEPTANKGHASNPVANMAQVVADGRLDAASTTAWYLAASPSSFDTIEVAYLDGNDAPYLEEMTSWTSDGVEMKVRIDAGVAPLDHRTLYKNPGA